MKIFIWHRLEKVTSEYHSGGGLVVIDESLEVVRAKLREDSEIPKDSDAFRVDPDFTYEVDGSAVSDCFVFPDKGCC